MNEITLYLPANAAPGYDATAYVQTQVNNTYPGATNIILINRSTSIVGGLYFKSSSLSSSVNLTFINNGKIAGQYSTSTSNPSVGGFRKQDGISVNRPITLINNGHIYGGGGQGGKGGKGATCNDNTCPCESTDPHGGSPGSNGGIGGRGASWESNGSTGKLVNGKSGGARGKYGKNTWDDCHKSCIGGRGGKGGSGGAWGAGGGNGSDGERCGANNCGCRPGVQPNENPQNDYTNPCGGQPNYSRFAGHNKGSSHNSGKNSSKGAGGYALVGWDKYMKSNNSDSGAYTGKWI